MSRKLASEDTACAVWALAELAARDFGAADGAVMASWTPNGVLVVAAIGDRAMQLDHTMSLEGIAVPDGRRYVGSRAEAVAAKHEHEDGHR